MPSTNTLGYSHFALGLANTRAYSARNEAWPAAPARLGGPGRKAVHATMAASTARTHEIQNADRQPYAELADPATMEPSIWPVMRANSMRPIATWRPAMS